jgi:hypothetical protein
LGTFSSCHIVSSDGCSMSTNVSMSTFRTSGILLSVPGVFQLFICLIATLTSASVGGSKFILGSR